MNPATTPTRAHSALRIRRTRRVTADSVPATKPRTALRTPRARGRLLREKRAAAAERGAAGRGHGAGLRDHARVVHGVLADDGLEGAHERWVLGDGGRGRGDGCCGAEGEGAGWWVGGEESHYVGFGGGGGGVWEGVLWLLALQEEEVRFRLTM